ncbi:hypothetical protein FHS34_004819 [Streptomyces echinatus]|uniref:Uncharacterized protein n=1 Tax=Streptomyces echinatus TaxID=67293 RepID=A0A7W9PWN7_9ACTN|nr:hypothetical protein [Streptomyces echinatus]
MVDPAVIGAVGRVAAAAVQRSSAPVRAEGMTAKEWAEEIDERGGLLLGGLALAATSYAGAPWIVAVCAAAGAFIGLLPHESEHRRDVWRDWLRHRERVARLRITAAQARPRPTRARDHQHERSSRPL